MPVAEGIIVPIIADAKGLTDGIDKAKKSIFGLKLEQEKYESLAFTEKNKLRLIEYNRKIQDIQNDIKKLSNIGKDGFDGLGNATEKGANGATKAYYAIRKLAYILPGIGIAGIFNLGFEAAMHLVSGLDSADKRLTKFKDDYVKTMSEAEAKGRTEVVTIQSLVAAIKDESISREHRLEALKKLQKEYPEYFKNLGIELSNTKALDLAVNKLSQAIERKSKAQALSNLIDKEYSEMISEENKDVTQKVKGLDAMSIAWDGIKGALSGGTAELGAVKIATKLVGDAVETSTKKQLEHQSRIDQLIESYKNLTKEQVANGDLRKDEKETKSKQEKFVKAYHPKAPLYSTLGDTENANMAAKSLLLIRGIRKEADKMGLDVSAAAIKSANAFNKANLAAMEWRNALQGVRDFVFGSLNQAFMQTFMNIGQGGKSAVQSIISDLGNLIKKLISAALAAAALAAIMAAAGFGITGANGVVQNGFGNIFKSLFGGTTGLKLASGGITNGPTRALIGEGKEREVVTPLSQLRNIIGNMGGQRAVPVPQLYMRGADMWIMWQRQQQQNLRNY